MLKHNTFLLVFLFAFIIHCAHATNGYFPTGYNSRAVALGGATVALPQDAMAAATNPAGISYLEDSFEIGAALFNPQRSAEIDCTGQGACDRAIRDDSKREYFVIPSFSYIKKINSHWAVAAALYGNGGMNTHYQLNLLDQSYAALQGAPQGTGTNMPNSQGHLGIDLSQIILSPSLSYSGSNKHSWGASLLLGAQRFKASGLGIFAGISNAPNQLSNNGYELRYGIGMRVGWLWHAKPNIKLGASYTSKVYMQKFKHYKGLFANNGAFDIPAHVSVGLAYNASKNLTVSGDLQRIYYGDVESINNPGPTALEMSPNGISAGRKLGGQQGIGFGWRSIWVAKLGLQYRLNHKWTLLGGLNHGESPFSNKQVLINILAPATPKTHISFGAGFKQNNRENWSFSYMHAFNEVQSDNATSLFGSSAKIEMQQHAFYLSYQRKL